MEKNEKKEKKGIKKFFGTVFGYKSASRYEVDYPWVRTVIKIFTVLMIVVIIGNFAVIQLVNGKAYRKLAYTQQNSWRAIPAARGAILDCNGVELAVSVEASLVCIDPTIVDGYGAEFAKKNLPGCEDLTPEEQLVKYKDYIAGKISAIAETDYDSIRGSFDSTGRYKLIAGKLENEIGDALKAWIKKKKIKGVYVYSDSRRIYPLGNLASHVIGFTGKDGNGIVCGIEVALNDMLTGTEGRIVTSVDAKGNELPYEELRRIEPQAGNTAVLTLDANIQQIAETALREAIVKNGVEEGGTILVLRAKNADVLAMASYPDFDLNNPYGQPEGNESENWNGHTKEDVEILSTKIWRNKALTDTYEPGSTFKTITACIALEENVISTDDMVSDEPYSLSGWTISCWKSVGNHGKETFAEAIKNSCNPVLARLSQDIGLATFYSYVEAFGFRERTGLTISGEASSIFHSNPSNIDMAVASFGQRFQITPIQLATAYCAIANGGTLMQPRLVKSLVDENGVTVRNFDPIAVRQVISEETAGTIMEILESVVSDGTGSNAYVSGYRVAGKTGTSETTETETTGRYIASFIGVAPADDPEIVVLVVLDHPTVDGASGGRQAAPVAGGVIEQVLEYLEVPRRYTETEKNNLMVKTYVPNLTGLTLTQAKAELKKYGFTYIIPDLEEEDNPDVVTVGAQVPESGSHISYGSQIYVYMDANADKAMTTVPELVGMSMEEAYDRLRDQGLCMDANSIGTVRSQSIEAGTRVPKGTAVTIEIISDNTEVLG